MAVVPGFRVPDSGVAAFNKLFALDNELQQRFVSGFAPDARTLQVLVARILESGVPWQAAEVGNFVSHLLSIRSLADERLWSMEDVAESIVVSEKVNIGELSPVQASSALSIMLNSPSVYHQSKFLDAASTVERELHEVRFRPEFWPIRSIDGSGLDGLMLFHRMTLEYHRQDDEIKTLNLYLTSADLQQIAKSAREAQMDGRALEEQLDQRGIAIYSATDYEEKSS